MNSFANEIKRQYREHLEPFGYTRGLEEFVAASEGTFKFWLSNLHDTFKSGRFQGTKLLEIGSGPTVHNIASASAYFPHIVVSEYVEANREELQKWLRADENILDWTRFLNMVAELEGFSDLNLGRKKIESRIRSSVKSVVPCDVLSDHVIPPQVRTEYDVILTSLALEVACPDYDAYSNVLKKLNLLLRPGGALITFGVTEAAFWMVEGKKFHSLPLTESDIIKALESAGFGEIDLKLDERNDPRHTEDYKKLFFITTIKPEV